MTHNHPTIADIQIVELVYYDPELFEECYRFCEKRNIDCLPDIDDLNSYYKPIVGEEPFKKEPITDDRKLDGSTFLFQPDLLDRFQKQGVQFVFSNGEMTGVVHFSDYNSDIVGTYLFVKIAQYERDLRELLACCGLTNDDMKGHFQKMADKKTLKPDMRDEFRAKIERYDENREALKRQDKFISFYLNDLIGLANREKVIRLNDQIKDLRNTITHAGPVVEMEDVRTPDFIYKIESFTWFFKRVLILLKDGRRIRNRLIIKRGLG